MSVGQRDLIWFRAGTATFNAATVAAGTLTCVSIPASASYLVAGDVPVDAHKSLKGTIEHLWVRVDTSTTFGLDFVFFRGASYAGTNPETDRWIDHESIVGTDWHQLNSTSPLRAGKSGLEIPYLDTDYTKKFHFGIVASTAIEPGKVTFEWAWRPASRLP